MAGDESPLIVNLASMSPEEKLRFLVELESARPTERDGFIHPLYHAVLPVELQSSRKRLTFATTPSGRFLARRTIDAYNALLNEHHPLYYKKDERFDLKLLDIERRQHGDGELIPRILESVDGSDVFVFVSAYDPSFASDRFQRLFGAFEKAGWLRDGITLDKVVQDGLQEESDGPYRIFKEIVSETLLDGNLMETYDYIRTLAEHNPGHITVIMPYYAYGRQNHPTAMMREATLARLVADLFVAAGADGVISYDPHSDDIRGFFPANFTCKMVNPFSSLLEIFSPFKGKKNVGWAYWDAGSVNRYEKLVTQLQLHPIYMQATRRGRKVVHAIQNYEEGIETVCGADDIGGTLGTLMQGMDAMVKLGVKAFHIALSHGLFVKDAYARLLQMNNMGMEALYLPDTIPQPPEILELPFIRERSHATLLANIINSVHYETSASQHAIGPPTNG